MGICIRPGGKWSRTVVGSFHGSCHGRCHRRYRLAGLCLTVLAAIWGGHGCGSPQGSVDGSAPDGNQDAVVGESIPVVVGCTSAELAANDKSATPGQIELFSSDVPPGPPLPSDWHPPQYRQHCITIQAGQSIDFSGDFDDYPLEPNGGDTPNPIPLTVTSPPAILGIRVLHVVFPAAGVFGYDCPSYPMDMFGAVRVVP